MDVLPERVVDQNRLAEVVNILLGQDVHHNSLSGNTSGIVFRNTQFLYELHFQGT